MMHVRTTHHRKNRQPGFLAASWDAWRTARHGTAGIARRQQARLQALVSYARAHSSYFAERYREVPEPCTDIGQLPDNVANAHAYMPNSLVVPVAGVGHWQLNYDPTGCLAEEANTFLDLGKSSSRSCGPALSRCRYPTSSCE